MLARAFVADAVADLGGPARRAARRCGASTPSTLADRACRSSTRTAPPQFLEALADQLRHARHRPDATSTTTSSWSRDTFRRFADDKIRPVAEHVHRTNADIPEDIIAGLAEIGGFGLSVPEEYGGFAAGGESDYLGMVVATEELSRGSLGIGGSLITRPEILTRALVAGGTEEQKQRVAAAHRDRRAHGRRHGHRARLRLRRRRREGRRATAGRRRLRRSTA